MGRHIVEVDGTAYVVDVRRTRDGVNVSAMIAMQDTADETFEELTDQE